jgi:putative oxidoreductase
MKKILGLVFAGTEDGNPGLLLLRVFAGLAMMTHGVPKLMAGPETWAGIGGVLTGIGMPGPAVFWGFMAAVAEGVGGGALALGLATRWSASLVAFTMTVAALVAHRNDPFDVREKALLFLFIALLYVFKGGGRYSADRGIRRCCGG